MKKIFLICLSAGFISNGFAQSSVSDVPENKIRPAYENTTATKAPAAATPQKAVATQPVLNSVGLNAHDQPNLKPAPTATKPVEVTKTEPTAQQDALKQQQQTNKVAVVLLKDVANNGGTVVQQKQPATENKPENNSQTQPVPVVDPSLTAKKVDAAQAAIEKNQPAAPNLPPGMKHEAVGAATESKQADTKTQPAVPSGDKKMSDNRKQN